MWEAPRGPLGQPHAPQAGDGAWPSPSCSSSVSCVSYGPVSTATASPPGSRRRLCNVATLIQILGAHVYLTQRRVAGASGGRDDDRSIGARRGR